MLRINGLRLTLVMAGVSAAIAGLNTSPAEAALLFTNGVPLSPSGLVSDLCAVGTCGSTAIFNEVGDNFTLSSRSVVQSVLWAGAYDFGDDLLAADNFSVRIFDLSNGVPPAMPRLEYSNIQVSRSDFGGSLYLYRYDLSTPVTLASGNYFLSVVNNTSTDPDDWFWAGSSLPGVGNPFFRDLPQQSDGSFPVLDWQPLPSDGSAELSFAIRGQSVPTPALLPGLIGLGAVAFKKRRQQRYSLSPGKDS